MECVSLKHKFLGLSLYYIVQGCIHRTFRVFFFPAAELTSLCRRVLKCQSPAHQQLELIPFC